MELNTEENEDSEKGYLAIAEAIVVSNQQKNKGTDDRRRKGTPARRQPPEQ